MRWGATHWSMPPRKPGEPALVVLFWVEEGECVGCGLLQRVFQPINQEGGGDPICNVCLLSLGWVSPCSLGRFAHSHYPNIDTTESPLQARTTHVLRFAFSVFAVPSKTKTIAQPTVQPNNRVGTSLLDFYHFPCSNSHSFRFALLGSACWVTSWVRSSRPLCEASREAALWALGDRKSTRLLRASKFRGHPRTRTSTSANF